MTWIVDCMLDFCGLWINERRANVIDMTYDMYVLS